MPNKYPKKKGWNVLRQNYKLTNWVELPGNKLPSGLFSFFKSLFLYQKQYPMLLFLLLFGIAIGIIYECTVPIIFKWLFDSILPQKNVHLLVVALAILSVTFIMLIIANFIQASTSSKLGAKVANLLRFKMYQKIEQHSFDEKNESDVLSRFSTDIAFLENVIFYILPFSILYSAMTIIGLSILMYFNWKLTLLVVIIMPVTLLLPRSFSKLTTNLLILKKQNENGILSSIQERILMSDIIRLLGLKRFKRNQFNEKIIENEKISYNYSLRSGLASRTTYLGVNLTRFLVFAIGAYLVIINQLSVGELIGFIILLGSVNASISGLANLYPQLNRAEASLKNIEELIGQETSTGNIKTKTPLTFSREISYQNIEFKIGDRNILSGVNIKINAGEFVAFVGPSGSGKSTLIKLLLKEESPTYGKITIDEKELELISTSSLLSQIGVVTQQPKLFELSVIENIRMGKLNALDDEIISAAQKAEIHQDILKFSHQYDTVLHKNDTGISGGQAQRITIARALINHPKILCLDEATSALDPINGAAIDDMIARLSQQNTNAQTIIAVTHRLKSIAHADTIFVLENGKIIESGKHEELLKNNGLYEQLWTKQQGVTLSPSGHQASIDPQWLKLIPLFESLDDDNLKFLSEEFVLEHAEANKIIFNQGDPGDKLYIIVAGIVEVIVQDEKSKEKKIAKLTDGDFFGEIALLYDVPRTATIKTCGVCVFLTLYQQQFQRILKRLPENIKRLILSKSSERISSKGNII